MRFRSAFLLLLVVAATADVCLTKRSIYVRSGPAKTYPIVKYIQKGIKFLCDNIADSGYVKVHGEKEYVSLGAVSFVKGSNAYDPVPSTTNKSNWPRFAKPFSTTGVNVKYFLQNDPRWANVPYTIHNDKRQTIGSSGCGPTCAAMAVVTLTGMDTNPLSAARFSLIHGDRTYNKGTAYNFFQQYFTTYGLRCEETDTLSDALKALEQPGHLVVASVGPGYWTTTGHYILLYAKANGNVYARDPLHPNRRKTSEEELKKEGIKYFIVSQ